MINVTINDWYNDNLVQKYKIPYALNTVIDCASMADVLDIVKTILELKLNVMIFQGTDIIALSISEQRFGHR